MQWRNEHADTGMEESGGIPTVEQEARFARVDRSYNPWEYPPDVREFILALVRDVGIEPPLPLECINSGRDADGGWFQLGRSPAIWQYNLSVESNNWVVLNDRTIADDEWGRLSVMFDYQTDDPLLYKRTHSS